MQSTASRSAPSGTKRRLSGEGVPSNRGPSKRHKPRGTGQESEARLDAKALGFPELAVNDPRHHEASTTLRSYCDEVIATYKTLQSTQGFRNAEIDNILAADLKKVSDLMSPVSTSHRVAFLGLAGAGKSSTINSILCLIGAAAESDSHRRGTTVIHEYGAALPTQTEFLLLQARYCRDPLIRGIVDAHCKKIFEYLDNVDREEEEEENDAVDSKASADIAGDLNARATSAIEYFHSLLHGRPGFESEDAVEKWFGSRREHPFNELVTELTMMISEFKSSRDLKDSCETRTASTLAELAEVSKELTSPPPDITEPHPYALIEEMQISLQNDLLRSGITLADTPGINDKDTNVKQSTRRYLRRAGTIFVFTGLERSGNTPDLDANLSLCLSLGKMHRTHLVVTGIDKVKNVRVDNPSQLRIAPVDMERLCDSYARVEELKDHHQKLKDAKRTARDAGEWQHASELDDELQGMAVKLAQAEARIRQVSVEIHTRDAEQDFKKKFRELGKSNTNPDVAVHFISNPTFQQHLAGFAPEEPPCLNLEATGIPTLRAKLYGIAAEGKLHQLHQASHSSLPAMINGITAVATKPRLARKQQVEELLSTVISQCGGLISDQVRSVDAAFKRLVTDVLNAHRIEWQNKAAVGEESLLAARKALPANTFRAFCHPDRNGQWKKHHTDEHSTSWNAELQEVMIAGFKNGIDQLLDVVADARANDHDDIEAYFSLIQRTLQESEDFMGTAGAEVFYAAIHAARDAMLVESEAEFDGLANAARDIWNGLVVKGGKYVQEEMKPTYDACFVLEGTPVPRTRVRRRRRLADGGQPRRLRPRTSGAHQARVDRLSKKLLGTGGETSIFAAVTQRAAADWKAASEACILNGDASLAKARRELRDKFAAQFLSGGGMAPHWREKEGLKRLLEKIEQLEPTKKKIKDLVEALVEQYEPWLRR